MPRTWHELQGQRLYVNIRTLVKKMTHTIRTKVIRKCQTIFVKNYLEDFGVENLLELTP